MKKAFLGIFVAATFIIYSVHQRQEGSSAVVIPIAKTSGSHPAVSSSLPTPTNSSLTASAYKDGQYTGNAANAYYGYIQVGVTVKDGKITDVQFLQHPSARSTSERINSQAMSYLKQEAIQAQSAHVDGVSGATDTTQAFIESLTTALNSAKP